jgi:lipoprotein LpqH
VGTRLIDAMAAMAAVAVTAGCGLVGTPPNEPSQKSGQVTIGDKTHQTQSVKCTQVDRALQIAAKADQGGARVLLQLGGDKPIVKTVSIENIDGLNGISGGDVGKAEASLDGSSIYTITGTAVVSGPGTPGQTTDMPFTIEAPC